MLRLQVQRMREIWQLPEVFEVSQLDGAQWASAEHSRRS
jgi:hypothetical protein